MATLGQKPQRFILSKFREANGAIRPVDQTLAFHILTNRDFLNHSLVQPRLHHLPLIPRRFVPIVSGLNPCGAGVSAFAVASDDGVVADEKYGAG